MTDSTLVHALRRLVQTNASDEEVLSLLRSTPLARESLVGKVAPDFEATAVDGGEFRTVKLGDYRGRWVVLFFYPADFTFVCPTEIIAFSDRAEEFRAVNAELIGVSCDSQFTHLAWINTPRANGGLGRMNIPLVADFTKSISLAYGVVPADGMPFRGLFLISPTGIVRQVTINDKPVGRNVDEALRLLQAFQFTDTHGEVCPANWTPGAKTMVADPVRSMEYFSTVNVPAASTVESLGSREAYNAKVAATPAAKLLAVEFVAPWCQNCKKLNATVTSLLGANGARLEVAKVNADQLPEVAAEHKVSALPTFIFYRNGAQVTSYTGSTPAGLEAALTDAFTRSGL